MSSEHIPVRVFQERPGEISWACSCGCINKHWPLPAELQCAGAKPEYVYGPPEWRPQEGRTVPSWVSMKAMK